MKAELLSIGSELAAGLTVDTNAAWLAAQLAAVGFQADRHVTVTDDRGAVAAVIRQSAASADAVVVTGGLGPTADDVTREALAETMGVPLVMVPEALERIRAFFRTRGRSCPESNTRQALIPRGAELIDNAWGTAPGIRAEVGGAAVYCLPGVPWEMRQMYAHSVGPELLARGGGGVLLTDMLSCFGVGEAWIGEQIADLMEPDREVMVGTTAHEAVIGVRFVARAATREGARRLIDRDMAETRRRLGLVVIGPGDATLEEVVGRLLREAGLTVSTAESCTGGLLAKRLTDVPGSSRYFVRGVVTYSDRAKVDLLGVDPAVLKSRGAVSEEVARAMAEGCRARSGTDFAMSTTGIAGPTGGTPSKPVGLVYVALADGEECVVKELKLGQHISRESTRLRTCSAVLNMLRLRLLG